ncbi:MAG TPA: ABC transporter permease [Nitrospiraceae bacterium]|nr:ABC transporter permease [Nitrospiraceae bacterium]
MGDRLFPPGLRAYLRALTFFMVLWFGISLLVRIPLLLPSPVVVSQEFLRTAVSGEAWRQISVSLRRLATGYALALAVGIGGGLLAATSALVRDIIRVPVEVLRPISGIAWIPVALYALGPGNGVPVFIIFYAAVFPILLNTVAGVEQVDRRLVQAARTLGATTPGVLRTVVWPAALPVIVTGARIGLGNAWAAIIVAELVGSPSGLGFAIERARQLLRTDAVLAWIAYIGLLGYGVDATMRWLARRVTWHAG